MPTAVLLNGPNLNRLGSREPEIYGTATLSDIEGLVRDRARVAGWKVETFQSNHEGALIDRIHAAADAGADGIIINPGALSHYSRALADAIQSVATPVIEVHISDISKREEWRRESVTRDACAGFFAGHGIDGYLMALDALLKQAAGRSAGART